MPRLNGFSAKAMPSRQAASAACAWATHCRGVRPPCSLTLSFGRPCKASSSCEPMPSDPPRPRSGIRWREMGMYHAPLPLLLAEHHAGARDECRVVVVEVARRRLLAGPLPTGVAMAPHHGEIAGDDATNVEGRPIARLHVLPVELPQTCPVVAAVVGVAVEIEKGRLGRWAEERLQVLPIKPGIHVEVLLMQRENGLSVFGGAPNQTCFTHRYGLHVRQVTSLERAVEYRAAYGPTQRQPSAGVHACRRGASLIRGASTMRVQCQMLRHMCRNS